MTRLTAADSWFLYAETERVHTHVTGTVVLDPSTSPDPWTPARLRAHIESVAPGLHGFRQRIVDVPFGIDHPLFLDDPDFDLDHHLRTLHLPRPGGDEELAEFIGRFASTQLDRSRPLWEMVVVEGLAGGRVALVAKMHHTIIDGVTGVDMMAYLLSLTPDGEPLPVPGAPEPGTSADWAPAPLPGRARRIADATLSRLTTPGRPVGAVTRSASGIARAGASVVSGRIRGRSGDAAATAAPFDAPRTPWNRALTTRRAVAFGRTSLTEVREARAGLGEVLGLRVTVNDIVLAATTLGLRTVLRDAGAACDRPLVASVPVSVHGAAAVESTNQVSNMFAHLPVHLDDPLDLLAHVHGAASEGKALHRELGPDLLGDLVDLIPPPVFHLGAEAYSRGRLADLAPPIHNLVVSNVPGSPVPLYMAGAEVVALHPFGPLVEGTGLNVTVLSHLDDLHVGIMACPDVVDDVPAVAEAVLDGFEVLSKLAHNHRVA